MASVAGGGGGRTPLPADDVAAGVVAATTGVAGAAPPTVPAVVGLVQLAIMAADESTAQMSKQACSLPAIIGALLLLCLLFRWWVTDQ